MKIKAAGRKFTAFSSKSQFFCGALFCRTFGWWLPSRQPHFCATLVENLPHLLQKMIGWFIVWIISIPIFAAEKLQGLLVNPPWDLDFCANLPFLQLSLVPWCHGCSLHDQPWCAVVPDSSWTLLDHSLETRQETPGSVNLGFLVDISMVFYGISMGDTSVRFYGYLWY